jgi:hypothetical protein
VESFNVFYHLSYEGAVDLASVSDPIQREAMRSQISQWGQIPIQLFSKQHVHREPFLPPLRHLEPNFETMPLKMMRLDETMDTHVCNLTIVNARTIMVISDDHTTNQLSLNMSSVDGRLTLHPIAVSAGRAIRTHPNSVPLRIVSSGVDRSALSSPGTIGIALSVCIDFRCFLHKPDPQTLS